jgi:GT2 family glycosyltransferase
MRHADGKVKTKITIGITTFNDYSLVDSLLESIFYFTDNVGSDDIGIVINDDGSKIQFKTELYKVIEKYQARKNHVYLIDNYVNQGITKAWNNLSNFFDSEYIILLNNDIMVTRYWLKSMIYFLENNRCCSASLPCWYVRDDIFKNITPKFMDRWIVQIVDPITKEVLRNQPVHYVEVNENRPGRVMCPAGMLFGFTKEMYNLIGGFDESTRQFYNESQFGTDGARMGYSSYALPFPHCYHIWSYTFKNNKEELQPSKQMQLDREAYIKKFNGDIRKEDPNNPHPRYMPHIPPNELKWLSHDVEETFFSKDDRVHSKKFATFKENTYQETPEDVASAGRV